ncbi:MAG: phosphotransferase [Neisseriales bacterium]|nr:MAG: phosphotransferase [Neisseriales bacterium]
MLRQAQLKAWLATYYPEPIHLEFAAADAEFRRYFRLFLPDGHCFIIMDALPHKMHIASYIQVREQFSMLNVPKIFRFNQKKGFMVLEDMGDTTYLTACMHSTDHAYHQALLFDAVDELITLQQASQPNCLPIYHALLLRKEVEEFIAWFCRYELQHPFNPRQKACWDAFLAILLPALTQQPKVFVHHDYMVRNIMYTGARPGILDFQDAVYGPITYDIASLLKDAFIEWDETLIHNVALRYWTQAQAAHLPVPNIFSVFCQTVDWMSIQRHLKVIGVFARLYHRDGKKQYLPEIRRFLNYLDQTTSRYKVFWPFNQLLHELTDHYVVS